MLTPLDPSTIARHANYMHCMPVNRRQDLIAAFRVLLGHKGLPGVHVLHNSMNDLMCIMTNVSTSLRVLETEVSLTFNDHPAIVRVGVVREVEAVVFAQADGPVGLFLKNDVGVVRPEDGRYTTVPKTVDDSWIAWRGRACEASRRSLLAVVLISHFQLVNMCRTPKVWRAFCLEKGEPLQFLDEEERKRLKLRQAGLLLALLRLLARAKTCGRGRPPRRCLPPTWRA